MTPSKDVHVTLVLEVEKHECLYNTGLPDYARKEVTEKAWVEVSKATQLPVAECKEKWRNIRSSFRRSLKPQKVKNPRRKRIYYLSRYLNFIVPFTRALDDSYFNEETLSSPSSNEPDTLVVIKEENISISKHNEEDQRNSPEPHTSWHDTEDSEDNKTNETSNSNDYSSEEDFSMPEHLKERQKASKLPCRSEKQEHMRYFFLSLLPEFGDMAEQETRTFKINVLQLIDEIKNERPDVSTRRK